MKLHTFVASLLSSTLATGVIAHVSMKTPCVRYTPFCDSCPELPPGQALDQNINAPIGTHDSISQPLCKYTTPYATPAAKWTAGSTVAVEFNPHAAVHGGGHCQFALSYDGGNTFVVIQDELRYCFTGGPSSSNTGTQLSYNIKLPDNLPSGDKVIFAWAWNNAIGNREFYMNCADVAIEGSGSSFSGPEMLVANYGPGSPFIPEFNGNYETGGYANATAPAPQAYAAQGGSGGYTGAGSPSASPTPYTASSAVESSAPTSTAPAAGSGSYVASSPYATSVPAAPTATSPFSTTPASAPEAGGYTTSSASVTSIAPVYHARIAPVPITSPAMAGEYAANAPPTPFTSKCV
ncbi:hypothetical protein BX070DRAFT_233452 [Coemansia spiralis]|nr:hypothetical protein BX070DRAFT_233452 [Coemansia spiralis]